MDQRVQYFVESTLDFLEDLDKEKLSDSQRTKLDELLRLSKEFSANDPAEEPEETYFEGGIYGEIGGEEDVVEDDLNNREAIHCEGAKILNLHASYKGWLRDDRWFRSGRWWCLIWRQRLLLYSDANTNKNPSKTLELRKETKVTVKGSDKLFIEINSGRKPKKFEFKVRACHVICIKMAKREEEMKIKVDGFEKPLASQKPKLSCGCESSNSVDVLIRRF